MRNTSSSYLYLHIHYYNYINKRSLFLLRPNEISLLPLIPWFSFLTVLTDFLTIIKYRKNDINNILWSLIIKPYHLETTSRKPNLKFVLWDVWIYDHIILTNVYLVSYLRIKTKVNSFLFYFLIKSFMNIIEKQQQQQPPSPAFRTLEQKSMNLLVTFVEYETLFGIEKRQLFDRWTK